MSLMSPLENRSAGKTGPSVLLRILRMRQISIWKEEFCAYYAILGAKLHKKPVTAIDFCHIIIEKCCMLYLVADIVVTLYR